MIPVRTDSYVRAPAPVVEGPDARSRVAALGHLWRRNWSIGWPERLRGLHYWLGFEYALIATVLGARPGERWLDVGTGAWSTWPYLLVGLCDVEVTALDVDPGLARQRARRNRAAAAGVTPSGAVNLVRGDARRLPFDDETFDGVTAVSTLEHVAGAFGDRQALSDIGRVLRRGGQAIVTVPFRAEGSAVEMTDQLDLYQRHYSPRTLGTSLLEPSGLVERRRILYGERMPFYRLSTRLPPAADMLRRPWDTVLTALLMRPVARDAAAVAVLCDLRKP